MGKAEEYHNTAAWAGEGGEYSLIISGASEEQLHRVGDGLAALGLVAQVVKSSDINVPLEASEAEPEPVPIGRQDFLDFAEESGRFTKRMAEVSWCSVRYSFSNPPAELVFLDEHIKLIELHSLRRSLEATRFEHLAWQTGSRRKVDFMRAFVEHRLAEPSTTAAPSAREQFPPTA